MCCRRSFGVSTWSTGISLDVPSLTPRRRHPGHLSRVALLELANPRFELACQADLVPAGAQHLLAERVDVEAVARPVGRRHRLRLDRKSTRLNSSHGYISYAVFCLKKKNNK